MKGLGIYTPPPPRPASVVIIVAVDDDVVVAGTSRIHIELPDCEIS